MKGFFSALILSGTVGPSGDIVLILETQSYRHAYGVNSQRMVFVQSLLYIGFFCYPFDQFP